ncbi:hypothetical protein SAMN05421807_11728 [Virgibacillus chiguensis]|uniref:Uncharacterized protein n=1 Tax=Virgibacillus chiguensis TaxID=411959 RepID=A0A1M5WLE0_9BACI|nr:hypothetical protein SAMN05421807_11728 [Virgibacillus chiguensis]
MRITNYFLKNKVYKLNDLITNSDVYIGGFDNQSLIKLVQKNKAAYVENGLLMLEGGLIFRTNGKEIGSISMYDDLPSLYAYYLNAVEEYLDSGEAGFYYPSQPIEVVITKDIGLKSKVTIDANPLIVMEKELLQALIYSSQCFFEVLFYDLKLRAYKQELLQIETMKKEITKNI